MKRDPRARPLCRTDAGCPKGTPESPRSLSPRNRMVFRHNRECEAVGSFPDDWIVRQNAVIINHAIQEAQQTIQQRAQEKRDAASDKR